MKKEIKVGDRVKFLETYGEVVEIVRIVNYDSGEIATDYKVRFLIDEESFTILVSEEEIAF